MSLVNGIDVNGLKAFAALVAADPKKGMVRFGVNTAWTGRTRMVTRVDGYRLGDRDIPKDFSIVIDEPPELLGANEAPNPQEFLMAAFNSCMMVGYVVAAAQRGVTLEKLEIATAGELDLRGFLGLDPSVPPGYTEIRYTVTMKGNGTPEQFREIHEQVMKTSPNRWNIANPIKLSAELVLA